MAKTEKELQELKEKVEELKKELKELSDEELEQVAGGRTAGISIHMVGDQWYWANEFGY